MAISDQTISRSGVATSLKSVATAPVCLTPTERLVLARVVEGLSSKEIARALNLSPRTIEFHRANLLRKWAAKNTTHLALKVLGD
jgi:DNA-binding NarL/FixJ family response regulator